VSRGEINAENFIFIGLILPEIVFASQAVPVPDAEKAVWWVIEGQNLLERKGGETIAEPGEITVCSQPPADCNERFRVIIDREINLTKAAELLKNMRFDDQMFQLSDLARKAPKISVTNEAGRIILRAQ
jgi:hypothetical protein